MSLEMQNEVNTTRGQDLDAMEIAKEVFEIEAQALVQVAESINENFNRTVELISTCKGRTVVVGIGKSGHIGNKIAATLASTGTPSFFAHATEMGHGDLGMLKEDDVVIAISFSGNTDELRRVLYPIKRLGVPLIAITGNNESILAEFADHVLLTPIDKEACPLDLAPTSSTTATLVMGDALAVALMKMKNFQKEDFAKSHPLGSLGKSLTLVSDLMRKDQDMPKVQEDTLVIDILEEISKKKLGLTTVLNSNGVLVGTITDGDLRRAQMRFTNSIFEKTAADLMSESPKTISEKLMAVEALKIMQDHRISDVVVVDSEQRPVGVIDLKDLLKAGLL